MTAVETARLLPVAPSPVLTVFLRGAAQICRDPRFTAHVRADGTVG